MAGIGVLASLAAKGYVVASVEYRLSSEARFPASRNRKTAVQDVKAAIRWLRAHAATYRIDKNRAVVMGGSAGGQSADLAEATAERRRWNRRRDRRRARPAGHHVYSARGS